MSDQKQPPTEKDEDDDDSASTDQVNMDTTEQEQCDDKATKKRARSRRPPHLRARKPKDMPRRPLSGYNYFFKDEREKMLVERAIAEGRMPGDKGTKVGFQEMAKEISKRWKAISDEELAKYKKLQDLDLLRYRNELEQYEHALSQRVAEERRVALSEQQQHEAIIGFERQRLQQEAKVAALEKGKNEEYDKKPSAQPTQDRQNMTHQGMGNATLQGGGVSSDVQFRMPQVGQSEQNQSLSSLLLNLQSQMPMNNASLFQAATNENMNVFNTLRSLASANAYSQLSQNPSFGSIYSQMQQSNTPPAVQDSANLGLILNAIQQQHHQQEQQQINANMSRIQFGHQRRSDDALNWLNIWSNNPGQMQQAQQVRDESKINSLSEQVESRSDDDDQDGKSRKKQKRARHSR